MDSCGDRPPTFDQLFDQGYGRVLAFLRRQGFDPATAEDLAQDVFERIHAGLPSFRGDGSIWAWVFGIARNVLRSHLRGKNAGKRKATEVSIDGARDDDLSGTARPFEPASDAASPEDIAAARETLARVTEAVGKLPHHQRVCITMWGQGEPYKIIAETLGIASGTVKAHIHRARRALEAVRDSDQRDRHA